MPGTLERRLGELGIGVLWALFCLMNFFPPSGQALAPWLVGPLSGLASLHFMRRAFDGRPRLVVDSEGVTDCTALVGGAGMVRRTWMKLQQALGVRTVPIMLTLLGVGKRKLEERLDADLLQFERGALGLSATPLPSDERAHVAPGDPYTNR